MSDLILFKNVKGKSIEWIYPPYIPKGKVSLICGNPGCGKTTFALALTALLSRGDYLPLSEQRNEPLKILYQTAEDGLEDTIIPRLKRFDANFENIAAINNKDLSFIDYDVIEESILDFGANIIFFDPLQAFIGKSNISSTNEMRTVLGPLSEIANRTGCAIVILFHFNKNFSAPSMYRILGSIDIVALARSILVLSDHPDDENKKVLCPIKNNFSNVNQSLVFKITDDGITWLEYCDIDSNELSQAYSPTNFKNACDMLTELLKNDNMKSRDIIDIMLKAGIGFTTLKKAKKHLNVKSKKIGKCWYYEKLSLDDGAGDYFE